MNSHHLVIESLENRQLLSVSASTLAGLLTKGTSWNYNIYSDKSLVQSYAVKMGGVVSVGGLNCNEIDSSQSFPEQHETSNAKTYVHLGSAGLLTYKSFTVIQNQTITEDRTIVYSPPLPQIPATMVAKHTYSIAYANKATVVDTPGSTNKVSDTGSFSIELASDKTSKLKTAGGTFDVYTVYTSNSLTESGHTTKNKATIYYAAGYGMVETDIGTESIQLLKYKKAPKAASAIAITSPFSDKAVDSESLASDVIE